MTTLLAGWKLVPIEPTDAMVVEGVNAGLSHQDEPYFIYAAMLATAPAAPSAEQDAGAPSSTLLCAARAVVAADDDQALTSQLINVLRAACEDAGAPAAGDALDAARWRAYARLFPEVSASFLATHAVDGNDPLPTIKGASITGGYIIVTPAGWDSDKATKVRDAILRLFPVNPAYTPQPSAAQRQGDAQ
jgi:cytochrome c5